MTSHKILYFAAFIMFMAVSSSAMRSPGHAAMTCPQIGKDMRPALLFVEGTPEERHLGIAYLKGEKLRGEVIMSAKYLEVTQLDNAVFLISASATPQTGAIYVMDLESGRIKRIGEGTSLRCLRAEPGRKAAMLVESDGMAGVDRLVELGLASLVTADRQVLSKTVLGEEYDRIGHPFKISPDFTHIAYVSKKSTGDFERTSDFELKSLDLRTFKAEVLDSAVLVQIPTISSFSYGIPPFEWISNNQVLYQHMIAQDNAGSGSIPNFIQVNGMCVFKIADIRTGEISECFRKELRMEFDGGSLTVDPLTGRLILNRNYVFDYVQKQLTDINLPFAVHADFAARKTEITSAASVLYSGAGMCMEARLSRSGSFFAYLLRPDVATLEAEIHAVFNRDGKPIKVAAGTASPTRPIGWIE
jgi:hypothetical protein